MTGSVEPLLFSKLYLSIVSDSFKFSIFLLRNVHIMEVIRERAVSWHKMKIIANSGLNWQINFHGINLKKLVFLIS